MHELPKSLRKKKHRWYQQIQAIRHRDIGGDLKTFHFSSPSAIDVVEFQCCQTTLHGEISEFYYESFSPKM